MESPSAMLFLFWIGDRGRFLYRPARTNGGIVEVGGAVDWEVIIVDFVVSLGFRPSLKVGVLRRETGVFFGFGEGCGVGLTGRANDAIIHLRA